jgi:alkylation response protein AidB-like acyl-CoA dehydrogenase
MDMQLDSEQELIRETAATFLAAEFPVARMHAPEAETFDAAMRRKLAGMGWLGMTLSEEHGGVGYSVVEEMLVFRECGRVLVSAGLLSSVLAARLASEAGAGELARALCAGEHAVSLAIPGENARRSGEQVSGAFRFFGAREAAYAIWVLEEEAVLFDLSGAAFDWRLSLDKSTPMATVQLDGARVVARTSTPNVKRAGRLLAAAFLQGASEAMRDMIVEYAKIRQTFGRPIGAYQAVRHPCAEMALRSEQARCQLFVAALVLRDGRADVDAQVDAAKLVATTAAIKNADSNIQLHGGIGVTDEHDAHLYLKRVHMMSRWLGGEKVLLRRLVEGGAAQPGVSA